jgi:hypothetical protein
MTAVSVSPGLPRYARRCRQCDGYQRRIVDRRMIDEAEAIRAIRFKLVGGGERHG